MKSKFHRFYEFGSRAMDGPRPINFDDHMAEQHAKAVIELLKPNLVSDWRIRPTDIWGRFRIRDESWMECFEVTITYREDRIRVLVCKNTIHFTTPTDEYRRTYSWSQFGNGRFDEIPIEIPNLIELLYVFVLEELEAYEERCIIINR